MKKVLVIGLGSMGKRRVRLLSGFDDVKVFGVDGRQDRREEANEKFGITCFSSINDALLAEPQIDRAVISTSPLAHAAIVTECLQRNLHVFTELNLVDDGYAANMAMAREKGLVLFQSSTALYKQDIQKTIERIKSVDCPLNYIYHIGQYLPDWHPWESYNNFFIGDKRTNGPREILAVELPWLIVAFGKVKKFHIFRTKDTKLNVDYEDNYMIMFEHESGAKGMLATDVVARKAIRHFEIYGEQLHITWDGTPDTLYEYDINTQKDIHYEFEDAAEHVSGYASFVRENPYRDELREYFAKIEAPSITTKWSYEQDLYIIKLMDELEA